MDKKKFAIYLKERYEDQVNWYKTKSAFNQKWAKRMQISILVAALSTTVSAIIAPTVVTVFFSALGVALLSADKYYKFDELWNNYRTVRETLKKEKYAYEYGIGPYENVPDKEKLFIARVEQEVSKENTEWIAVMHKKKI